MRGRPHLFVSYEAEQSLFPTWTQRILLAMFALLLLLATMGTSLEAGDWSWSPMGFLADSDWQKILSRSAIFAIGALGINILTGLAGQISVGHSFFVGIGAYTATVLGSAPGSEGIFGPRWGMGLPIWIWLPAAGIVAALVGVLVAPTAVRVRGLYLGFVTLGLVFIGQWAFRNFSSITGGSQTGRKWPGFEVRLWREESPLLDMTADGPAWFWLDWLDWLLGPWINLADEMSEEAKVWLFVAALAAVFVLTAKNLQRTRIGRSFMALRDRDIAAEVMGVPDARTKLIAFAISSFYAGVAGGLFGAFVGRLIPEGFDLFMSVQFLAIILIGGAGTVAGTLMGTAFVVMLPRLVQDFSEWLNGVAESGSGILAAVSDWAISTGQDDGGLVSVQSGFTPGLSVDQLNLVIYGLLIVLFLIFEPLGLYGIWIRIRNYWKGWPFTY